MTGDIELAGEGTFECEAGGVGSCGPSVGVGYESTDDLRDDFSGGTVEVADGGDGGAPGPKDGMAVGMLLVLTMTTFAVPLVMSILVVSSTMSQGV